MCKACFREVAGVTSSGTTKRPRGPESRGGPDTSRLTTRSGRNVMTCAVEWCDDRAQTSAVDGQRYCKKHSNWNQTRKGVRCPRVLLEDYKDSQHPLYSCNTNMDGSFDGKCNDCQALHFKTECAQVASGADGKHAPCAARTVVQHTCRNRLTSPQSCKNCCSRLLFATTSGGTMLPQDL